MLDEEKLLCHLMAKDAKALDDAIEIYTPYISVVLYNTFGPCLSSEDSEETVADVFISLWQNAGKIDLSKGSIRSYLASAAKHSAIKKLQKSKDYTPIEDIEIGEYCIEIEKQGEKSILWDAVMSLGEPDNEIFVRFYRYDQSLKSISKALSLNLSTVKTRLSRGKKKLKQILTQAEEEL